MMVLLDSDVVLRFVEPGHPQHRISANAVRQLRNAKHDLVLVPQVLYEFWVVATREVADNGLGMTSSDAAEELRSLRRLFRLLRDERAVFQEWERIVFDHQVAGKQAHDARLVAAMARHGISHLLTYNTRHFARYEWIVLLNPSDASQGVLPR